MSDSIKLHNFGARGQAGAWGNEEFTEFWGKRMYGGIFDGAGVSAQVANGMAMAFFARAFSELSGHLSAHGGAQLPEEIDPAARNAAYTLVLDLSANNEVSDLADLYECARLAHRTGEGFADMTPILYGAYLALQSMAGGDALAEAFGARVAGLVRVPYVEFGAHSLTRDYSAQPAH